MKCLCVRMPRFRTSVRHWTLRRKIWISHWPMPNVHTAIAQPIPMPIPMWTCQGAPNSVQWLACKSNNLCVQQPYYVHGSNSGSCISCVRMLRCNSDGHFELGTVWAMDPTPCLLAHWTRILRIRQHIVWESHGDQHKTASPPCHKPADDKRVAFKKP